MIHWQWPWNLHGKQAPARPRRASRRTILTLDILEDRLALSTAPIGPQPLSYADWRSQTFSVENMAVVNPPASAGPSFLQPQDATPSQGEGFGTDINLPQVVANYPYKGRGYSVAIIDTGIDYNNPALGGGWGKRVIAGYNFVANTSDPLDDNGHGTHVAGIIGSSDPTYTGIAPGVNFVALKVLDSTGSGTFGAVDQALQWVAAHQAQYHIVAVNMSLGSGNFTTNPYTYLESDFTTLKSEGVFIATASGNSFFSVGSRQGLAYPAISPQVVSIGAVWDGNFGPVSWVSGARDNTTAVDNIASFTQRSTGLDILAPGAMITSTYLHNTFKQMAGTSMATPVVAGAAVLIHEALDARGQGAQANQDYILNLMQSTGVTITDGAHENDNVVNTGLSFKRLDLFGALNKVGPVNETPPTLGAIPTQTMTAGVPLVVNLAASSSNGAPLTFHAQITGGATSALFQLGQQLGLGYAGSYFINSMGQNEKWLLGTKSQWYCLMPNGDLRRWMGDAAGTLAPAALVTMLTPAAYSDPTQFWTAPTTGNLPVTFAFAGNQLTLQCDSNFLGSFTVVVSASDGFANASQSFTVNVTHRAPVLSPIANQTMAHALKTLTVSLATSNPDNDPLAFSAQVLPPSQQAYNLQQSLGLSYTGNYWINFDGVGEKWLKGTSAGALTWYCLLPNGELRRAGASADELLAAGSLVATLDSSFYQDPTLLWNAQLPVTAAVAFSFTGNQLTITPAVNVIGSFAVQVTINDGQLTSKQTFTVTVTDSPPVLGSIGAQTVVHGKSLTVNLTATNAGGDSFAWSVQTVAPSQQAINLEQTLGLKFTGNYWTNTYGQGEIWLLGTTNAASSWYCLLPNGGLRRAGASAAEMLGAVSLVATLDANYYANPSLLWNAQNYTVPSVTYKLSGNQVTITPAANFFGTFLVETAATDGAVTGRQMFPVTVTNQAPVLNSLANQTMSHTGGSITIPLAATDADGDTLTYTAQTLSTSQLAFNLKQTLGLSFTGKYWTNYYGTQEKWLRDQSGQWYCLLPDGELRRAGNSAPDMLAAGSLVATLDSSYYQDPSLLWNAQIGVPVPATLTLTGNQLTLQAAANFIGTFTVQVTVSDGIATSTKAFTVTVPH